MPSPYAHFRTHHQSRRLRGYEYTRAGCYFVTICTKDRHPHFGSVARGIVGLNDLGCTTHEAWRSVMATAHHIRADAFIVMPNRVHALVTIHHSEYDVCKTSPTDSHRPSPKSLGVLIGSFKAIVSRRARRERIPFAWQARFHDHIVCDAGTFQRVRAYIRTNPDRWYDDCFYRR